MHINPKFWLAGAGVLVLAAVAQEFMRMEPPPPEKVEVPAAGVTVAMDNIGGRPLVNVTINGKGPYPFILDTGASITAIDPDLIKELALPSAHGGLSPMLSRAEELRVGDAVLRGVTVLPAPGMLGSMGGATPPRGILSASYFSGALITLDYPGKKVIIRNGALPAPDNQTVFAYNADDTLPRLPIKIAGHEFRPHVDSGSPSGLTLPMEFSDKLPLSDKLVEAGRARTPGGEYPILRGTLAAQVELGGYKLDVKEIRFSDLRPGSDPAVGNLGYAFLKDFVITLDSKNRRLKFDRQ
jgi:Aspartyl protease